MFEVTRGNADDENGGIVRDEEVRELNRTIDQLKQTIEIKDKALSELEYAVYDKMVKLNAIDPEKDRDEVKALKNGLKFLADEFKSKSLALKTIKESYSQFKEY